MYSPPHINKLDFIECFESLLQLIRDKTEYVALGDINIDILVKSVHACRLTGIVNGLNCTQIINNSTRATTTTSTLLDHIYVSFNDKI